MPSNLFFRWIGILCVIVALFFSIRPSFRFYSNDDVETIGYFQKFKNEQNQPFSLINFSLTDSSKIADTSNKWLGETMSRSKLVGLLSDMESQIKDQEKSAINLGLDLKGGTRLEYEVDMSNIIEKEVDYYLDKKNKKQIYEVITESKNDTSDTFLNAFIQRSEELELKNFFTIKSLQNESNESIISYFKELRTKAISSAIRVIGRRVNKSGMAEPTIRKKGSDRIVIELAGIKDTDRAEGMIETRANLKFLKVIEAFPQIYEANDSLYNRIIKIDKAIKSDPDLAKKVQIILEADGSTDKNKESSPSFQSLFLASLSFAPGKEQIVPAVYEYNVSKINNILALPSVRVLIDADKAIMWSTDIETDITGNRYRELFLLEHKKKPIGQGDIENAAAQQNTYSDPGMRDPYYVSLTINSNKKDSWRHLTKEQHGKRLAIVLNDEVYTAPRVADDPETKRNGMGRRVTVTGGFNTRKEANDLATVIVAGQLDAPLIKVSGYDIDASLGKDSISSGFRSMVIGLFIVLCFMVAYYRWSGAIASLALLLNLFFILGFFGLMAVSDITTTLTLPGIAGIILTIGMSVDANVIIFERIREEINAQKRPHEAVHNGYEKAFVAIVDANFTTFIAALVLGAVASGPIQGFALTLMIGIVSSIFSAVFITKTILLTIINYRPSTEISI